MKILVVTQYFWPENFRVNDFVLSIKEQGHDVVVFTGKPNYPVGKYFIGYSFWGNSKELWHQIPIWRAPLSPRGRSSIRLLFNYLSFAIFGSIKALFIKIEKPDIIIAYQQSPVTAAIPAIILKRRFQKRMVLYIQDLWPESVTATTNLKNKHLISCLEKLSKWIYGASDQILMQSMAFKDHILAKGISEKKVYYLPNSADSFYKPVVPNEFNKKYFPGRINIVFGGNIGEAQHLETPIAAAKLVKSVNQDIHWTIIGEGRKKDEMEKLVKSERLDDIFHFIGSFQAEKMPELFAHADALLITLKRNPILSLTIPSKLQSYLACGKPIIGAIDGEGARVINEAECGFCSDAQDFEGLARNVLHFSNLPVSVKKSLGEKAILYFHKEFDRQLLTQKLIKIIS